MNTPIVPQKPINHAIYEAIHTACMSAVENMPETQEIFDKRDALLAEIKNKISRKTGGDIEDISMELACQFGAEMFRLGIALGRNPDSIFDLPN